MRKAIDIANWTLVPTRAQIDCWRNDGYERLIVGVSYGNLAPGQLAVAAAGGMEVEAYGWVSFGAGWAAPLDRALSIIAPHPVKRLWLDCEQATMGATPGQVVARIAAAIQYVRNRRPDLGIGIYTAAWWWVPNTNNAQDFRGIPLWTAEYVSNPLNPPNGIPRMFGGWASAAMWQYAGTIYTCGLNTDRNVILEAAAVPPEGEDMKPFLCWSGRIIFVGPGGPRWVTKASVVQELAALLKQPLDSFGVPLIGLSGDAIMALGGLPNA